MEGTPNQADTLEIVIKVTDNYGAVAVGTFFLKVMKNPTDIDKKDEKSHLPNSIKLNQNYPNPFNPTTTIKYTLNTPSHVKLTVFDLLGQKIRMLQNRVQYAGEYSLVWDATDNMNNPVSSGIYFYSLETGDQILQKKMLLVR